MTNAGTPSVAPGWYPDPAGSPRSRWWDGAQWTEHFYDASTGGAVENLKAPEGTPVYNVWIWLVVFLPYLTLPLLFTLDVTSMFTDIDPSDPNSATAAQLSLLTSPGYIGLFVGGFLTSAATVFAAYRDWRWLQAAGVPRPFHWAWGFINLAGYPVYAIGRAVITKRRTGKGIAVMWVTIAMIVLAVIIAIVWSAVLFSSIMNQMMVLYN